MGENALLKALRQLRDDVTVHGFRSSFRDWAAERTAFAYEVAQQALAHTIGNKVERSYRRTTLPEQRARLMTQWASYVDAPPAADADVVPMRRA